MTVVLKEGVPAADATHRIVMQTVLLEVEILVPIGEEHHEDEDFRDGLVREVLERFRGDMGDYHKVRASAGIGYLGECVIAI